MIDILTATLITTLVSPDPDGFGNLQRGNILPPLLALGVLLVLFIVSLLPQG